jgi:hypothetical protein
MFAFGQSVTVWDEITDEFGDTTTTDERTVLGCAVAPRTSTENLAGQVQITTGVTLYAPPDAGIKATSRVRLPDGTTWQVVGDPGRWSSPLTRWYPGDQVELERVRG